MNRNVEIKARVESLAPIRERVKARADEGPAVLEQKDTFFACPHGRLKLRQLSGSQEAELIFYERPDGAGPKESRYLVHRTNDAEGLAQALSRSLGVRGVVCKRRELFRVGQTRVHLDEVQDLGTFVELEVVLRPEQSQSEGTLIAADLMRTLGISDGQLVDRAYLDLLHDRPHVK